MARIVAISSQVVRGHVGLSAIVPALQRLGHEVLALPTILLSNHPGHHRAIGTQIEVNTLDGILDALAANGWLADIDAVLTGYLPSVAHVQFAERAIERVQSQSPAARIVCDPVMGDDPKGLYIAAAAAGLIRDRLVPRAGIITPNRFELSWLAGVEVGDAIGAVRAAARLAVPHVLATSVPHGADGLANVAAAATGSWLCRVTRQPKVPHGTGDLLTALLLGHLLAGQPLDVALGRAVAGVDLAISASRDRDDLALAVASPATDWAATAALPLERV